MVKKYTTGLVIGRFQPFHKGHHYLFEKALKISEKIIVGIGSSQTKNKDNPFDYKQRMRMLKLFIKNEKISQYITKIVALPDTPGDDDLWLKKTLQKTGKIDVVIGNNDWVNGIFKNANIPVLVVGHYKRYLLEGKKIRKLMSKDKNWEERVPIYLKNYIKELATLVYNKSDE